MVVLYDRKTNWIQTVQDKKTVAMETKRRSNTRVGSWLFQYTPSPTSLIFEKYELWKTNKRARFHHIYKNGQQNFGGKKSFPLVLSPWRGAEERELHGRRLSSQGGNIWVEDPLQFLLFAGLHPSNPV